MSVRNTASMASPMNSSIILSGLVSRTIKPKELLSLIPHGSDDLVLLTGTLVRGIGNETSDYDIYVIGEQRPLAHRQIQWRDMWESDGRLDYFLSSLGENGPAFDVDYISFNQVEGYLSLLAAAHERARTMLLPPKTGLAGEAEDFITGADVAIPLANASKWQPIRQGLQLDRFGFVKFRELSQAFDAFEDILGAWQAKDFRTCLHNLRDLVMLQTTAVAQLYDGAGFKRKWFMHILDAFGQHEPGMAGAICKWLDSPHGKDRLEPTIVEGVDLLDELAAVGRARVGRGALPIEAARRIVEAHFAEQQLMTLQDARRHQYWLRTMTGEGVPLGRQLHLAVFDDFANLRD